jgi:hypothetical protein
MGFRASLEDPIAGKLSYRRPLIDARSLARSRALRTGDAIGLMLNANGAGGVPRGTLRPPHAGDDQLPAPPISGGLRGGAGGRF